MTTAKKDTPKTKAFSADERAAMKERAKETKVNATKAEEEKAVLDKIAELSESERAMATRFHEIMKTHAPTLAPKTWYGMPAYARDGKIVCFFQSADKFKARYATIGFNDDAKLDDGNMWPVAYALTKLTDVEEAKIIEMVKRAVS